LRPSLILNADEQFDMVKISGVV